MTNLMNILSAEIKNPSLFLENYTYRNQINYQSFSILSQQIMQGLYVDMGNFAAPMGNPWVYPGRVMVKKKSHGSGAWWSKPPSPGPYD
jgi:hypothetical protein